MSNVSKNTPLTNGHRYAFDTFVVDPVNRVCLRDQNEVRLTNRVMDLLLAFVENPGRLLEKDELINKVWHEDFVEEGNLARNISMLRKALGDTGRDHIYIATIQGHGYKFIARVTVTANGAQGGGDLSGPAAKVLPPAAGDRLTLKWLWPVFLVLVVIAGIWFAVDRYRAPSGQIRSIAVLPFKVLDSSENYIGVGIADAVIRRINRTGQIIVRPTSAVMPYLGRETDAITAARQLRTDAVLEGNLQRSQGRVRISLDLLRTEDGVSLWSTSMDVRDGDIFLIQDTVAEQVAKRLELHLDPVHQAGLSKRHTTSPAANDFFVRGIFNLDQRDYGEASMSQMEDSIELFKRATELDPNYALAHAELAYAYTWTALFIEPTSPKWAVLAREEVTRSQAIDPELAESHLANALLLWSGYSGFRNEDAIRELLLAQQLDPAVGHNDLAAIYQHIGLENAASRELQRALEIDPTSQNNIDLEELLPYLRGQPDEWLEAHKRLHPEKPESAIWYDLRKGNLKEAESAIGQLLSSHNETLDLLAANGLLHALRGENSIAEEQIPLIKAKLNGNDLGQHHTAYDIACIYALNGKAPEAVQWLRTTAETGFPNYPLFERDPYLARIRSSPEFIDFMNEERIQWENFRAEFGD